MTTRDSGSDGSDPFDLDRFVDAQAACMDAVLAELRAARKRTHWMWFVFPQVAGLGFSAMAQRYAIGSVAEARAYLAHPVLGPRLHECTTIVAGIAGRSALDVFGSPDDMKLRSSMTLFDQVAGPGSAFAQVLERLYGGERDGRTMAILAEMEKSP